MRYYFAMSAFTDLFPQTAPLLILAPMAGVTDAPFRQLSLECGADLAVSEMVKSHGVNHENATQRALFGTHSAPKSVQIIGNDPKIMAATAKTYADIGADIIDINMGCPAKKFAKKPAGSALMGDVRQVREILKSIVNAVDIPVSLKIRTGVDDGCNNALEIGHIAEAEGIQALAIHGRSRIQKFRGEAEHHTAAALVADLSIPVFANGDIEDPIKATQVLKDTAAAGLLIGRAARRNPWIFREIRHYLTHQHLGNRPSNIEMLETLQTHLATIWHFYPSDRARQQSIKQLGWCLSGQPLVARCREQLGHCQTQQDFNQILANFLNTE